MKYRLPSALFFSVLLFLGGCGAGGGQEVASNNDLRTSPSDASDALFQADRLLQVDIEMDPAEYDILRQQGRYLTTVFTGCAADFEYSHFKATVTVDGEVLNNVDVRKKGFLGSLSASRPSFKLNFDTHEPGRRFMDLERMTLNNNNQDPSNTHTCMAYDMFRAAGLPAPRCSFAEVRLNGESLGIYSHVESIKKHFLRRNFSSDEGNLYEAQLADFGEFSQHNFQAKTNEELNNRTDLELVVTALQADDGNLPGLLNQAVDVEAFISFWAMETISGHWDSATGNANNYFIYRDPGNNLFYYIPWGADAALEIDHQLAPGTGPLYRYINISARLYQIPAYREKYHARVLQLLDQLWGADALHAEVDRIRELTGTEEEKMAGVRTFIDTHDGTVRAVIAGEQTQLERTFVDQAAVCDTSEITSISGSITNGAGFVAWEDLDGKLITVPVSASPAVEGGAETPGNSVLITLIGSLNGELMIAPILIDPAEFGRDEIPLHGASTMIVLGSLSGGTFQMKGATGAGTLFFDSAAVLGAPVNMHFSAELLLSDRLLGFLGGG